jgi:tetratricopeptide (TPR) repeat protein
VFERQEDEMAAGKLASFRFYFQQRPVMLALLSVLAVVLFLMVTGLSRAYQAQREALGNRWFNRGVADLNARRFDAAVSDFRSALLYSRDDFSYQLNLAEALLGLSHTGEASAYLLNLWEREPENGLVNLELARIAAQQGQTDQAVRYYHDAIYATWSGDDRNQRRSARLELIELLLRTHSRADAQAELIAFAENAGEDPAEQERIGGLFLRSGDGQHALAAYQIALKTDHRNPAALAGAGEAAFRFGSYPLAQKYLQAALAANPNDAQSADRLKTTAMVLSMDPFRRPIFASQRNRAVVDSFTTAGQRLKNCPVPASPGSGPSLSETWNGLQPQISELGLRRNPDLIDSAMDLVFRIERQTNDVCGTPSGPDLALLLIARLHEGN